MAVLKVAILISFYGPERGRAAKGLRLRTTLSGLIHLLHVSIVRSIPPFVAHLEYIAL